MHIKKCHFFDKLKQQLATTSTKYSLHLSLLTAFWLGLLTIQNDTIYLDITNKLPPAPRPVIQSQAQLGWDQLYYGCITKTWEQAIDQLNPNLAISGH